MIRFPAWGRRGPAAVPLVRLTLRLCLGLALLGAAAPARAGTEEWSTFDPEAQEEDDESGLDHFLTRTPHDWRDAWERSAQGVRTAQGCLTSGQWFVNTDLKTRAPLGDRATFGVVLRQSESDVASYNFVDFQFRFPTRFGTPGAWFRPIYDKSRQDFALTWEVGTDTTAQQLNVTFAFEDVFNNLWAFRQTRVGRASDSEPYERHPYEPGVRWVSRHPAWRAEVSGRWLTPSRKRVIDYTRVVPERQVTLWGTLAGASLETRALGLDWELQTENRQARGSDSPADTPGDDGEHFRRAWSVETAARREVAPRLTAEARWRYESRDARRAPPDGPATFAALDRILNLEAAWAATPGLRVRLGGLHDRVTVAQWGGPLRAGYGTRTESRLYVGLSARFGSVIVSGIEGIELDPERYDVWGVHDKGFLQLQATF